LEHVRTGEHSFQIMDSVLVEVCADSVASAVAAERGGAARIELCSGLIEGGITPSAGLIATVRAAVSIPLHVMIRPRGGDFCYDSAELDAMRRDIAHAARMGANGVVFGILNIDAQVEVARMRELVEVARPLEVTFHRAFDMAADFSRALEDVCESGVSRLLTSGGEQTSWQGQGVIAGLVKQARGRIVVMPGSGIKPENAREIVEQTGAREIHVGLRSTVASPMIRRNPRISMGAIPGREYLRAQVLEDSVRSLCEAVSGAS
jgi:copper homeostasis protein